MTLQEMANHLQVSLALVRKWKHEGRFETVNLGDLIRVPIKEVKRSERNGVPNKPKAARWWLRN
jgi:excisionase family DNA binding protein